MDIHLGERGARDLYTDEEGVSVGHGCSRGHLRSRGHWMQRRDNLVQLVVGQASACREKSSISDPYRKEGLFAVIAGSRYIYVDT